MFISLAKKGHQRFTRRSVLGLGSHIKFEQAVLSGLLTFIRFHLPPALAPSPQPSRLGSTALSCKFLLYIEAKFSCNLTANFGTRNTSW